MHTHIKDLMNSEGKCTSMCKTQAIAMENGNANKRPFEFVRKMAKQDPMISMENARVCKMALRNSKGKCTHMHKDPMNF